MSQDLPSNRLGAAFRRLIQAGGSLTPLQVLIGLVALAICIFKLPSFLALAVGAAIALSVRKPILEVTTATKIGNRLMKASIIALGAGMNLFVVFQVGATGFAATALTLMLAIGIGWGLGRALGVQRDVAMMVTVGTAICGGSAIAATAPVLGAKSRDIGVSLGVVFILNAIALFLFPLFGTWLQMDPAAFGRWTAFAIHDTSSVIGAAAAFGPEALEVATITKLARALWIIPVVLIVSRAVRIPGALGEKRGSPAVPRFILGFVGCAMVVSLIPQLQPIGLWVAGLGRIGLLLALYFIGLGFSRDTLSALGFRAMLLGVALWVPLAGASLGTVMWLG